MLHIQIAQVRCSVCSGCLKLTNSSHASRSTFVRPYIVSSACIIIILSVRPPQMQADRTRLLEHNTFLRKLYADQFHSSRKVVDELCNYRQQIRNLRCQIGELRQLVHSFPIDFLRETQAQIGTLVSLNKIQVQQKLQQQLMERRGITLCACLLIQCYITDCYSIKNSECTRLGMQY